MKQCPHCGKNEYYSDVVVHHITVSRQSFSGKLAADTCKACKKVDFNAENLAAFELSTAYLCVKLMVESPEAFKFMREAVNIMDNTMAGFLGVTPTTIRAWERGSIPFGPGAFAILRHFVETEFNRQNICVWADSDPTQRIHCSPKLK